MHAAGRRVLCLSEYFVLLRARRHQISFRCCRPTAARGACGDCPRGGIRHPRTIRVSYATSVTELDRGLERMRKFLAASVRRSALPEASRAWLQSCKSTCIPRERSLSIFDAACLRPASLGHARPFADLSQPQVRGEDRRGLAHRRRLQGGERSVERAVALGVELEVWPRTGGRGARRSQPLSLASEVSFSPRKAFRAGASR